MLDLAWHKKRAEAQQSGLELEDARFSSAADHTAAAADRLPWPTYRHLECAFDGEHNHFKHPLGKGTLKIRPFATADIATDSAWESRPMLDRVTDGTDFDQAQFFAFWRLWRWWTSDQHNPRDPRMAFLPADTRLPDHTIWAHNSLVSAFQSCVEDGTCRPAFLLFNIGPVQDFIAAARRTLDLWSGSYLLSYLTGAALKHIALTLGPDQVIFPNLCGQPIFDLLLKARIWEQAFIHKEGGDSLWKSFGYENDYARRRLLTPSLPNRFLALVPASQAKNIARDVERIVRKQLKDIANSVWELAVESIDPLHGISAQKDRFFVQVEHHMEISWQVLPWPAMPHEALNLIRPLPKDAKHNPADGLRAILDLASKMPKDHRDVRNFECERFPDGPRKGWKDQSKLKDDAGLDNPGAAWSSLYSLLNWQLDAVRQNRTWKAWTQAGNDVGLMNEKDSLTGKEEAVLNLATGEISDEHVKKLSLAIGPKKLFKQGEIIGAITLIKRLWPYAWLKPQHGFDGLYFRIPDTRLIAQGRPFDNSDEEDDEREDGPAYFAVLAFDGDEMGKWISGSHPQIPKLSDLLANYTEAGQRKGAAKYFEAHPSLKPLLDQPRPLNPSFHLQFSEMLGTFSNVCARRIVEAFDGYLVYSGGDDVLALLPSRNALACAQALRQAFRGTKDLNDVKGAWEVDRKHQHCEKQPELKLFQVEQEGFVQLHADNYFVMAGEPKHFPAIVPGPAADCSVGIAIAHFKSPLQDVVQAAQVAEKRAKNQLGRAAFAITLMKRSGEITEWGAQWTSGALALYDAIAEALDDGSVSAKFPHRVCQLLEPYLIQRTKLQREEGQAKAKETKKAEQIEAFSSENARDIIQLEFAHAAERQGSRGIVDQLRPLLIQYLNRVADEYDKTAAKLKEDGKPPSTTSLPQTLLRALIDLCTTVAFAHRTRTETQTAEGQPVS